MHDLLIIGGGPSGMAAAHEAIARGAGVTVAERLPQVGGLARTLEHAGARFDIGPHRFFTRNAEVRRLFSAVVGEDQLRVTRLTRIFYRNRLFHYPLTPANAICGVGIADATAILASYATAAAGNLLHPREPQDFAAWVTAKFGRRLFEIFFRTYTEKVWGVRCEHIGADWAAQRIQGLSLAEAIGRALAPRARGGSKTLAHEFLYPRLGAGMFYERMAAGAAAAGGEILLNRRAISVHREGARVREVTLEDSEGGRSTHAATAFLCSAPLTELIEMMDPPAPEAVLAAARGLRFRDHISVDLLVAGDPFPDQWIYIHAPEFQMARVANYRNFSPQMAGASGLTPLTVEYFCFPGDALARRDDAALVELAIAELDRAGLVRRSAVQDGFVVRSAKAYPVIEAGYKEHVERLRAWLGEFENLLPIGRAGMFKYNNQDHAIATGLLGARSLLGLGRFDPWQVNIDAEYHEGGAAA